MMKKRHILLNGLFGGSLLLATACSEGYLETSPSEYLDEESLTEVIRKDPSKVKAYVTGSYTSLYNAGDYASSDDDTGLPCLKLAVDIRCEDIAYHRDAHFFKGDYQLTSRKATHRRVKSTWSLFYHVIDNANTVIKLLKPAQGEEVTDKETKITLGEAYSLRAYAYFWLINLWQHPYSAGTDQPGVPLKTDTEYRMERVSVGEIYTQILTDIDKGYNYLKGEGFHNGKVGISEFAAAAIYANALLFTGDNVHAAQYAEIAAKSTPLNSQSEMLSGFNSLNMSEVIWGYKPSSAIALFYDSFLSHVDPYMAGYGGTSGFRKLVASDLYDHIADNDIRKQWFGYNETHNINKVDYSYEQNLNFTNYLQNKFLDVYITDGGSAFTSSVIYLRSGEMYFVAAEAYYLSGNEAKAREMLNTVMESRIPDYKCTETGDALYRTICWQKRIETWMEGCRFFDAKRRGETIDRSTSINHAIDLASFDAVTYSGRDYRLIFHIPNGEMENNPSISTEDDNE